MRHISIKVRMTIWFTVVMVVISSLMLVFVMLMNRNQVTKPPAAQVVSVVTRNADRLEVEHGVLDLSDVDLFRHGVYTQVFDEEGQLLAGSAPTELTEQLPLAEGDVRQAQGSDGLYDVYDVSIPAASACPRAAARYPVWPPPSTVCATGWSGPSRRSVNSPPTPPTSCGRRWR